MSKKTIAEASAELYKLLEPFKSEERVRIVRGTLTLLGESGDESFQHDQSAGGANGTTANQSQAAIGKKARAFFDHKKPNNKIEELATAARFREQTEDGIASRKEDFGKVFSDARRNFDSHNFNRDINNARNAGFFNKGGFTKVGYTLSYYGQNYVDALPDRDTARKIQRPKRASGKKNKKPAPKVGK